MAVLFQKWPTDRLKKLKPSLKDCTAPLVLYEKAHNALRVHAFDEAGDRAGLFIGQPLADARALCPDLVAIKANAEEGREAFEKFSERFLRYSPLASIWKTGEVFIDIAGCERIFGGEARILDDVSDRLKKSGLSAKIAIAQTPGAAHAFAAFMSGAIIPAEKTKETLALLPVEALRIDAASAEKLRRFGLKRIGQLYDAPRAPLTARFRETLLMRLAQASGYEAEPLTYIASPPDYSATMRFAEPVMSIDSVIESLKELSATLCTSLSKAGKGGRRFELLLFRVDNKTARILVGTSGPVKSPAHIARLFSNRLEDLRDDIDAGFGFDQLRLSAFEADRIAVSQHDAFERSASDAGLSELQDRLSNRLGVQRVCRIELRDTHSPERADALVPMAAGAGKAVLNDWPPRPVRILSHPEAIEALAQVPDGPPVRFQWRRVTYRIIRANGPERIADEWFLPCQARPPRDYYKVEDEVGRRYWIFREGLYGGGSAAPKWFMHGFFS